MYDKFFNVIYQKFETIMVVFLAITLMATITYAGILFFMIIVSAIVNADLVSLVGTVGRDGNTISAIIGQLQNGVFEIFSGFLLILLGIELIGTVKTFAQENQIKLESIFAIAIIATARHLITFDYHHTAPAAIFGAGFVVLALSIGYYMLRTQASKSGSTEDIAP